MKLFLLILAMIAGAILLFFLVVFTIAFFRVLKRSKHLNPPNDVVSFGEQVIGVKQTKGANKQWIH